MNMRIERLVLLGALAIVLLIVVSTGFYTVAESEQAVVTTFGKVTSVTGAGLHLKLPWPIQARVNVPVNRTNKIELGYREIGDGYYESVDEESMMITGDLNIVNIDFFIEWRISDPVKYLYASEDPETILRNIAQGSVRSVVGTKTIDETLTVGKTQIQIEVKDSMLQTLDLYDIGVMVLEVKVNDSEPPTEEVAAAFRGVETAKQEKETSINQALEYRNGMLPAAQADADRILREAESFKESRIKEAEGQVARFDAMYTEYIRFPDITRERVYWETLEKILPGVRVYLDTGDGSIQKLLPLESFLQDPFSGNDSGTEGGE